jgi:RNA polymerase sigma-70 factor (ECF subfamily)
VGASDENLPDELRLSRWMASYQAGDLAAFDSLYDALEPELRAYFKGRFRERARVEDLIQETFLQLHRSRRAWLSDRPVRPWVFAIAKRVVLMRLRTSRRREAPESVELGSAAEVAEPRASESVTFTRAAIAEALHRLSLNARRAFMGHHWAGLSFAELGVRLGITPEAAKLRSSRAARQLRKLLDTGDGDE